MFVFCIDCPAVKKTSVCLLIFQVHFLLAAAQEIPRIFNFTKDQYLGYNQNWAISQSPEHLMLFGNSAGLLTFDGARWEPNPLPNNQIIRSVSCDEAGNIFTGAFGEFGYWINGKKNLEYYSLKGLIQNDVFSKEEIWNILTMDSLVFFQSFSTLYLYDYKEVRPLKPPGTIMFAQYLNEKILLPVINSGLFELKENGFEWVPGSELFADKRIVGILPHQNETFLVATSDHGIYEWKNGKFTIWNADIQPFLQTYQLNKIIRLSNQNIVLGTILNGLYVLSPQGRIIYKINQQNGLQNNTVLSLFEDKAHNLWVGLDKGIDLIELNNPLTFFTDQNGKIGAVYAAYLQKDKLYVGTNRGVFVKTWKKGSFSNDTEDFKLIKGSQGQGWEIKQLDNELIIGHNDGTFLLQGERIRRISDVTGSWVTLRHPRQSGILVQGTYTGLVIFKKNERGNWQFSHRVEGFSEPVKEMLFDEKENLWVAHPNRGLYKIQLDTSLSKIVSIYNFSKKDGLPSEFKTGIEIIEKQLIIKSGNQSFTYDAASNQLRQIKQIGKFRLSEDAFNLKSGIGNDWFKIYNNQVVCYLDGKERAFNFSITPDFKSIIPLDATTYLFGMDDGCAILQKDHLRTASDYGKFPAVVINGLEVYNRQLRYWYSGHINNISLAPNSNNLIFIFSQPVFIQPPQYSYFLEGFDHEWSPWQSQAEKEFTRLPPGDYIFKVKSNLSEEIATMPFSIRAPWYQTWWATVLYVVLIGLGFFTIVKWQNYRLEKQRIHLEQEKEKQIEEHRIKVANERLHLDIINKSKELANSTMNLVQKNEILMQIKEELQNLNALPDAHIPSRYYQKILHIIDTNISSEQDWRLFETNFNEVHEEFFKKLITQFPDLTPGDLKLAAYLKMNLSSKEIAPLLNISIQSVENKRYRLRKKLNLEETDNLIEFMLHF